MKKRMITLTLCAAFMNQAQAKTYLTADWLADTKSGKLVENPVVLIDDDGSIEKVGNATSIPLRSDYNVISLKGRTILPGLIDMHVHLSGSATKGRGYSGVGLPAERETIWGVINAEKTLMAGFTTVRDVGSRSYNMVALRDAINEGEVLGPNLYVSGPPVGIVGGHCSDNNLLPPEFKASGIGTATGPWEMRAKVRQNIKYGVDLIKTCSTGGVFSKGTSLGAAQGTVEELTAIVDEAHARGLKVASHAHGAVGIKNAIRAGVDTIEHASFLDDEAIRMAKKNGTYLSMDIYNTEYTLGIGESLGIRQEALDKERAVGTIQRESFTKASKAGIKMVFGSDAAIYPHGDNAKQLSRMVQFGMTPEQALKAATATAAEALGRSDQLGQIKAGLQADIIAVKGNPFEDITTLEKVGFVMKAGRVFKNN